MKVAIIGNCQARPVASFMQAMAPSLEMLPVTVIHLSGPGKAKSELDILDAADIVFSQLVNDDYPAAHLATSRLRERYQDKLVTWPNLFFTGNCADLTYITHANGRLNGPLDVYHNRFLFDAWREGVPVHHVRMRLGEMYTENADQIRASVQTSLRTLRERDDKCDVQMTDIIERNWQKKRLFFTFNHPSNNLLLPLVERMLNRSGIVVDIPIDAAFVQEQLSLIVGPTYSELAQVLGLEYALVESSKGLSMEIEGSVVKSGKAQLYSSDAMIRLFYDAYNAVSPDVSTCRFTPAYSPSCHSEKKAA